MSDLFAEQVPTCPTCGMELGKAHTLDECREIVAFRKKARASFEGLEWGTATDSAAAASETMHLDGLDAELDNR